MSNPTPVFASLPRHVRFFEDRAEVTRQAQVRLTEERQWVRVSGVTPLVDDRSVQSGAKGARVLAARVHRRMIRARELARAEIEKVEAEAARLESRLETLRQVVSRHEKRLRYQGELFESWTAGIARIPRFSAEAPLESWTTAYNDLMAAEKDELAHWIQVQLEIGKLEAEQVELQHRRDSLGAQPPRLEAGIEVLLEGAPGADIEVTVTYRTAAALWRPEHLARLDFDAARNTGKVTLQTFATVWQRTGEDWDQVEASFSTARPAQAGSPPLLSDDVLTKRKKTPEEKKKVVVEMREQTIAVARAPQAFDMPGVDDGGEPLEFSARDKVRLPGTGRPLRVEIAKVELEAEVSRVLMAERAPVAHLRARCVNRGKVPLLAGPVQVARGPSLVGRSRLDFVGQGENFELGFGPEDGVRCRRSLEEKRESTMLTGSQTVTREVTLYLSNLGDQAKSLEIIERVPVSEIEGLEVRQAEPREWAADKDGMMKRLMTLEPHGTKELKYRYEIRARSNVELPA